MLFHVNFVNQRIERPPAHYLSQSLQQYNAFQDNLYTCFFLPRKVRSLFFEATYNYCKLHHWMKVYSSRSEVFGFFHQAHRAKLIRS